MTSNRMDSILEHLRKAVLRHDGAGMTDGQLLENFVTSRDAAAFEALVRRHGRMVQGVCLRVLRNRHDAEDAFQATFLVLAHKAARVIPREMVGNWLYGVAHTTALRAKVSAAKRRLREKQVLDMPETTQPDPGQWEELQRVLDQELTRLPDKYRLPIVLCDLEGRNRKEVASQLKIPEGTLSSRLTTARRLLAKRMSLRGVALSGGAVAVLLTKNASAACMPPALIHATVKAASLVAAGQAASSLISAPVFALKEGVLKAMFITKLKAVTAVVVMLGAVGLGGGLATQYTGAAQQPSQQGEKTATNKEDAPHVNQKSPNEETGKYVKEILDPKNTLTLLQGLPRIMVLNENPQRIQIGDDRIVDFTVIKPKQVSVLGKKLGRTVLNMWFTDPTDKTREIVIGYLVRVVPDAEEQARNDEWHKKAIGEVNDPEKVKDLDLSARPLSPKEPSAIAFANALKNDAAAQTSATKASGSANDLDLVEKLLLCRRDYQKALENLRVHYLKAGDAERAKWAEEELRQYHRIAKQAFRLELDVPPPNLIGKTNMPEANKLFTVAMTYKDKGWGTDYIDNQRRSEILFQKILTEYPQSNKIDEAAYQLGDIYESKAYKQPRRSAVYFERVFQWNPKTTSDARIRAARIYDKQLSERVRAVEIYKEVTTHETDAMRVTEATKRLQELNGAR